MSLSVDLVLHTGLAEIDFRVGAWWKADAITRLSVLTMLIN